MKKITVEIADGYDDIVSFTFVGRGCGFTVNVATSTYDLSKGTKFIVDEDGRIIQSKEGVRK